MQINLKHIAAEALKLDFWVYDPSNKRWFTPEEFEDFPGRYKVGFDDYFLQIQVRDPREAIRAGFQQSLEMQSRLEDFVKKVTEYYR